MDDTPRDDGKRLNVHTVLSVLTLVIGIVLLTFMIAVESEPGLLPLLLTATGAGWYFITRARTRSLHK